MEWNSNAVYIGNGVALPEDISNKSDFLGVVTAAGAGAGKWNVWGNLTNNDTRQSYSSANGFTAKYNTDVMTSVIGVDDHTCPSSATSPACAR